MAECSALCRDVEADRDALRQVVDRVQALAEKWAKTAKANPWARPFLREVASDLALILPPATTTKEARRALQ